MQGHIEKTNNHSLSHSYLKTIWSHQLTWYTCFWTMGGSKFTQRDRRMYGSTFKLLKGPDLHRVTCNLCAARQSHYQSHHHATLSVSYFFNFLYFVIFRKIQTVAKDLVRLVVRLNEIQQRINYHVPFLICTLS